MTKCHNKIITEIYKPFQVALIIIEYYALSNLVYKDAHKYIRI